MGKETKEKGKHRGKKITQFPTQSDVQEELEDAAMDRFLRQSIIEDADRIERELNEDPKLIGIGASDDLFGKIVEELKTKGIWEGDKETNVDERPEPAQEEQQKPAVYDMLSEADREALAFGYQMQKKEQKRKEKRKKRNRRLKHVSAAVVALVFVGGIGFSTEASRRWIFQVGDAIVENFGVSIKNEFVENMKDIRIVDNEEEEAVFEIRDKLGITPVRLMYLPKEMRFSSYTIDEAANSAAMMYYYKEFIFTMNIRKNQTESVFYQQLDGEIYAEEKVTTEQGIEVQLYEVKDSKNKKTCMGEIEYNDVYYYCIGMIPYNEMKNILKYLMILNN